MHAGDVAPPLIAIMHDLPHLRVDAAEVAHASRRRTVRAPEAGEDGGHLGHRVERIDLREDAAHVLHVAARGEVIRERFEQADLRSELVIHGHPRDAGLPRHGIDGEARVALRRGEQLTCGGEDARARLIGGLLPPAKLIGTRMHEFPTFARVVGRSLP